MRESVLIELNEKRKSLLLKLCKPAYIGIEAHADCLPKRQGAANAGSCLAGGFQSTHESTVYYTYQYLVHLVRAQNRFVINFRMLLPIHIAVVLICTPVV